MIGMSKDTKCRVCEHAEDLKGCASKHVAEARRLISQGKVDDADSELSNFERHLKE